MSIRRCMCGVTKPLSSPYVCVVVVATSQVLAAFWELWSFSGVKKCVLCLSVCVNITLDF